MKTIYRVLPFFGLLTLLCCSNNDTAMLPITGLTTLSFKIGQERILSTEGENPTIINIKLRDIKEGRCAEKNCPSCYGGYAHVYFEVSGKSFQDSLSLNRISCVKVDNPSFDNPLVDQKSFHGFRIGLANITDYTGNNSTSDYSVQLLVSNL